MKQFARSARILATLAVIALVGPVVAACSTTGGTGGFSGFITKVENAVSVATSAKVPRDDVVLARNAFNALQITATGILRVRTCDGTNGPICRPPTITKPIIDAITAGRKARNDLTTFLKTHPNELGPKGLYDALLAANSTLSAIIAQYRQQTSS